MDLLDACASLVIFALGFAAGAWYCERSIARAERTHAKASRKRALSNLKRGDLL